MIAGIGVDCVQVERLEKSMARPGFAKKVFSPKEQALIAGRRGRRIAETAAGCWAGKEAFLKAAGRGLGGFALADIAVLRRENGAPYYALGGQAAAWAKARGLMAHLSLTHEGGQAIAFAVLESAGEWRAL